MLPPPEEPPAADALEDACSAGAVGAEDACEEELVATVELATLLTVAALLEL